MGEGGNELRDRARMMKKYGQSTAPVAKAGSTKGATERLRAKKKAAAAPRILSPTDARRARYSNKLASGDKMWGYSEADLDMSGYDSWSKQQGGNIRTHISGTKGRDPVTQTRKRTREEYAQNMAYDKAKAENKFGLTDYVAKKKEESSGSYLSKLGKAGVRAAKVAAPYAAVALGGAGLAGYGPLAGALGGGATAGTSAGGAAWGAGGGQAALHGTLPGVTGATGWAAGGGGAAALHGSLPGVGSTASGVTSLGAGITKAAGGLMDNENIWGTLLDFGLSTYANTQSEDTMKDAFKTQNPWAKHQGAMGDKLMGLINDPSSIEDTPGYQFQFGQGMKALQAKQASTGNRFSGRALTESIEYGQGLASQIYNQEMNRYAGLAGANVPNQGGIDVGQNVSSLQQQQSYNTGYALNQIFGGNKAPGVTDQKVGGGGISYNNNDGVNNLK